MKHHTIEPLHHPYGRIR